MSNAVRTTSSKFLSSVLALSLLLLLGAHSGGWVSLSQSTRNDLSAYVLPDGTLPLICEHSEAGADGQGDRPSGLGRECPACVLCKTLVLASAPVLPEFRSSVREILPDPLFDQWRPVAYGESHQPRAPPVRVPV